MIEDKRSHSRASGSSKKSQETRERPERRPRVGKTTFAFQDVLVRVLEIARIREAEYIFSEFGFKKAKTGSRAPAAGPQHLNILSVESEDLGFRLEDPRLRSLSTRIRESRETEKLDSLTSLLNILCRQVASEAQSVKNQTVPRRYTGCSRSNPMNVRCPNSCNKKKLIKTVCTSPI